MQNHLKEKLAVAIALAVLGAFSYVPLHAFHMYMDEVNAAGYYSPEIMRFLTAPR